MNAETSGIGVEAVTKIYPSDAGPIHALEAVDLRVKRGEFVVLLGPSGCGKTTLLRLMGGLLSPTNGDIRVSGRSLWRNGERDAAVSREMGMVFQDANLIPWYSIEKNIALPLQLRGINKSTRTEKAHELCDLVGISGFEKRWPRELSGGMRQRAAIARALSYDPNILLMDEPFGALDAMTRDSMNLELQRIWMTSGCTIVLVTHSIPEAVFLADRIILMTPRPGRIDRILDVNFERPRELDLSASVEFQEIAKNLRHRLEEIS
ncbi:MAG: ABC transporter ATP-binding protein [Proteobacteria bacterium]|nr:ABC transporter ATP-binding protein [Pseudomonadota bacterium]